MRSTVLVSGASNQLGVFLVPRLRDAGHRVLALSRRAPAAAVEVAREVRWLRPRSLSEVEAKSIRFMVSCGPLGLALDYLDELPGLERIVVFSTSSVLGKANSADPAEREQMGQIIAKEAQLREQCAKKGVALLLLRPTLIWGCGLDRNVSLLARIGRRFGFIPVAGEAAGLRQPVHADDLAELAVRALKTDFGPCLESAACGGSTLSFRDMAGRIAAAGQGTIRVMTVPPSVLAVLVRLASLLPTFRGLTAEMVRRQARDLVFDDSILRGALEFTPREFHPEAGDFDIPLRARAFQLPGS